LSFTRKPLETIVLNLDLEKVSDDLLVKIVEKAESIIRRTIEEKVGASFIGDLNVLITANKFKDKITFTITVEFSAPKILEIDYEGVLEEASRKAFETIEKWLKENAGMQHRENKGCF